MSDERARRLAENESLARNVNEVVEGVAATWYDADERIDFRCECARIDCREHVALTRREYESVRSDARRFVVAAGHEDAEIERELGRIREHVLVEKTGPGVAIVEETDPRD